MEVRLLWSEQLRVQPFGQLDLSAASHRLPGHAGDLAAIGHDQDHLIVGEERASHAAYSPWHCPVDDR